MSMICVLLISLDHVYRKIVGTKTYAQISLYEDDVQGI